MMKPDANTIHSILGVSAVALTGIAIAIIGIELYRSFERSFELSQREADLSDVTTFHGKFYNAELQDGTQCVLWISRQNAALDCQWKAP